ncbi:MAG: hypothetical protein P8R42_21480 [Candidatus Binatia bacterium]|nr:hypothetical protein [Candidatus Binatia bacterium]
MGKLSRRLWRPHQFAVFGAYVATAVAGFALEASKVDGLPVYLAPSVGVVVVVLLQFGMQLWPTLVLAALTAGLLRGTRLDVPLLDSCLIALQATLACHALRSRDFRLDLSRLRDARTFIGVAFAIGILISTPKKRSAPRRRRAQRASSSR